MSQNLQTDRAVTRRGLFAGTAALAVTLGLASRPHAASAQTAAATASVDEILAGMTRRQKIEQMLMPDFRKWTVDGAEQDMTVLSAEVADAIDRYNFGGVILFANNVKETPQTLKLAMDMQDAALRNSAKEQFGDIPLLLTIDQEGASSTAWVPVPRCPATWPSAPPAAQTTRAWPARSSVASSPRSSST